MNIIVTLQLDGMPDDTDLGNVVDVIRRQVAEWLDFDRCPQNLHITATRETPCPPTA
jgi:hypothetical protein